MIVSKFIIIYIILPLVVSFLDDEIKSLFKKNKQLKNDLFKSYNKALSDWCKNEDAKYRTAKDFNIHLKELKEYLYNGVKPDNSLIILWKKELRNYTLTYQFITEQITRAISEKVKNIYNKDEVKPQHFDQVLDYIDRSVSFEKDNDIIFLERSTSKLIDIIINIKDSKSCYFILYSSAQTGKTTELKNLGYLLKEKNYLEPFYFDLNNYRPIALLDKFKYIANEYKKVILLLDAYDEINDKEKHHFISEINDFVNNNPNIIILISSRINFENENNFKEFQTLYLEPLYRDDILVYIKEKYCDIYKSFVDRVASLKLFYLLGTPFYLKEMLKYFNDNRDLPKTKSDLYKILIDESFVIDEKHKQDKGSVINIKTIGYDLLKKVAFIMTICEKKELSEENLFKILSEKEKIQLICHFSIFKRDSLNVKYSFEHIAFKEFLTADFLKSINADEVEKLFFYPNSAKLINSWYNIILLFIEIIQESPNLFEKTVEILVSNNYHIIIDASPSFLTKSDRIDIFKKVYTEYKSKRLSIDYFEYRKKLMDFAYFSETILFLKEQINSGSFFANYYNALVLLEYANYDELSIQDTNEIKKSLKSFLNKEQDTEELQRYLLLPFNNRAYNNEQDIEDIRKIIKNNKNAEIQRDFFKLLLNLDCIDNYADYIFEVQQYIFDYNHNGITQMISRYIVYLIYDKFAKIENILRALQETASEQSHYSREEEERITIKKSLLEKLSSHFQINKDGYIIDGVLNAFLKENIKNYSLGECDVETASVYRDFFNKNNQVEIVLNKEYKMLEESTLNNKQDPRREFLMPLLMTESYFKNKMLSFEKSDPNAYWRMNSLLPFWDEDLNKNLKSEIEVYFTSPKPKHRDWNKIKQEDFDLVLDYKRFKAEIEHHCDNNCNIINQREWTSQNLINECIYSFFYNSTKNKIIDIHESRKKVENMDYYIEFSLLYISRYLNYESEESLIVSTEEQKRIIRELVDKTIEKGVNTDNLKALLASITYYNFDLSDKQIDKLLPFAYIIIPDHIGYIIKKDTSEFNFSHNTNVLDLLIYKSNTEIIKTKISESINSKEIYNSSLYRCFSTFITKNKIRDMYKYLPIILYDKFEDYDAFTKKHEQNNTLYEISKINNGYNLIKDKLTSLSYESIIHFFSESRVEIPSKIVCEELEAIYPELKEDNQTKCLSVLLRNESKIGLTEFIKFLKVNEYISADLFPQLSYSKVEYLDSLIEVLDIALLKKRVKSERFLDVILSPIEKIAIKSNENLENVKQVFEKIIDKYNDFHFLNREIITMTEKFYESHKEKWTIKDALKKYEDLL